MPRSDARLLAVLAAAAALLAGCSDDQASGTLSGAGYAPNNTQLWRAATPAWAKHLAGSGSTAVIVGISGGLLRATTVAATTGSQWTGATAISSSLTYVDRVKMSSTGDLCIRPHADTRPPGRYNHEHAPLRRTLEAMSQTPRREVKP